MELLDALFEEEKDCDCCGKPMSKCDCDDDDDDDDDDAVIDAKPKLKGQKGGKQDAAEGYGKKKVKEDIERKSDVKMIKTKTPEGKVVWKKQRGETEVSKATD